jgi:hypothetical protein
MARGSSSASVFALAPGALWSHLWPIFNLTVDKTPRVGLSGGENEKEEEAVMSVVSVSGPKLHNVERCVGDASGDWPTPGPRRCVTQ